MSHHFVNKCEHGTVLGQCRCPSLDKTVVTVPCKKACAEFVAPEVDSGSQ